MSRSDRPKELTKYAKAFYYADDLKYIYRMLKVYCKENNVKLMDKCKFRDFYKMLEPMIANDIPYEYREYKEFLPFKINK
jgi:hypothetical protein